MKLLKNLQNNIKIKHNLLNNLYVQLIIYVDKCSTFDKEHKRTISKNADQVIIKIMRILGQEEETNNNLKDNLQTFISENKSAKDKNITILFYKLQEILDNKKFFESGNGEKSKFTNEALENKKVLNIFTEIKNKEVSSVERKTKPKNSVDYVSPYDYIKVFEKPGGNFDGSINYPITKGPIKKDELLDILNTRYFTPHMQKSSERLGQEAYFSKIYGLLADKKDLYKMDIVSVENTANNKEIIKKLQMKWFNNKKINSILGAPFGIMSAGAQMLRLKFNKILKCEIESTKYNPDVLVQFMAGVDTLANKFNGINNDNINHKEYIKTVLCALIVGHRDLQSRNIMVREEGQDKKFVLYPVDFLYVSRKKTTKKRYDAILRALEKNNFGKIKEILLSFSKNWSVDEFLRSLYKGPLYQHKQKLSAFSEIINKATDQDLIEAFKSILTNKNPLNDFLINNGDLIDMEYCANMCLFLTTIDQSLNKKTSRIELDKIIPINSYTEQIQ